MRTYIGQEGGKAVADVRFVWTHRQRLAEKFFRVIKLALSAAHQGGCSGPAVLGGILS